MKYFVRDCDRTSTVYHEFQKGFFDGVSFWKEDSLCIHDDVHFNLNLSDLFLKVIPGYYDADEIEVTRQQWERIMAEAALVGGEVEECMKEADVWVRETFAEYDVFTMIGL